jgi:hypothetical protein
LRDMLMDVSQKYRCETSTQFIHNGSKAWVAGVVNSIFVRAFAEFEAALLHKAAV